MKKINRKQAALLAKILAGNLLAQIEVNFAFECLDERSIDLLNDEIDKRVTIICKGYEDTILLGSTDLLVDYVLNIDNP